MSPALIVIIIIVIVVVFLTKKSKKSTTFVDVPVQKKNHNILRVDDMDYSQLADSLTDSQKYASMGLVFFFYGFCHETQYMQNAMNIVEHMSRILNVSKNYALEYCGTYLGN